MGAQRYVWNRVFLSLYNKDAEARYAYAVTLAERFDGLYDVSRKEQKDAKGNKLSPWDKTHPNYRGVWADANEAYPPLKNEDYSKALSAAKKEKQWLRELPASAFHATQKNFVDAVKRSRGYSKTGKKMKSRAGRPQPKSRHDKHSIAYQQQSLSKTRVEGQTTKARLDTIVDFEKRTLTVQRLSTSVGPLAWSQDAAYIRRFIDGGGTVNYATVTLEKGEYHVVLSVESDITKDALESDDVLGLDVGIEVFAATSDGELINASACGHDIVARDKHYASKVRRLQRVYARKLQHAARRSGALVCVDGKESFRKGARITTSNKMKAIKDDIAETHRRRTAFRRHTQQNIATKIAAKYKYVAMEDLNVKGMMRKGGASKRGLNRSIGAASWSTFKNLLQNKLDERGGSVLNVPAHYTSQTCPACKSVDSNNRLTRGEFKCTACGYENHADIVGALNIRERGIKKLQADVGGGSSPR